MSELPGREQGLGMGRIDHMGQGGREVLRAQKVESCGATFENAASLTEEK